MDGTKTTVRMAFMGSSGTSGSANKAFNDLAKRICGLIEEPDKEIPIQVEQAITEEIRRIAETITKKDRKKPAVILSLESHAIVFRIAAYINSLRGSSVRDGTCPSISPNSPIKYENSIMSLDLMVRPHNVLESNKIMTIPVLLTKTPADLLNLRGMGRGSLRNIQRQLASKNLHLKDDESALSRFEHPKG